MNDTPGPGRRNSREHHLIAKLEERRARHKQRPLLARAGVVVVGALVTLAGVIMTGPVPGPGFLVIPVGLAILALEFVWAERLLERAVGWAEATREKAANQTRAQKVAGGVLTALAIAAFVAAAILWDIPVLPV